MKKGEIEGAKEQFYASVGHETGHHTQFAYGSKEPGGQTGLGGIFSMTKEEAKEIKKQARLRGNLQKESKIVEERFAWNVARDFIKRKQPKQLPKFEGTMAEELEEFAFGTYVGTQPESFKKGEKYWDVNVSLIRSKKPRKNSLTDVKKKKKKTR
jgi:hypothetical protein